MPVPFIIEFCWIFIFFMDIEKKYTHTHTHTAQNNISFVKAILQKKEKMYNLYISIGFLANASKNYDDIVDTVFHLLLR